MCLRRAAQMLRPVMSVCYYVTRHRGADQQGSRLVQGRTQEGADGAKAPPPLPKFKKNDYLLTQIRSILCFAGLQC